VLTYACLHWVGKIELTIALQKIASLSVLFLRGKEILLDFIQFNKSSMSTC
jgi:hypothetical protein